MEMRMTNGWDLEDITLVTPIDQMGADSDICDAARVSFDKPASMFSHDQNQKLLCYLAKHEHWSPFAHGYMKFKFSAPLFIARQFQKHVVGFAWNEISRRYVDADPMFFVPHSWRKRPDNVKQGSTTEDEVTLTKESVELGRYMVQAREWMRDYRQLKLSGVCPEQARMVMPQAMMTEWIWSGSLQAWKRFVDQRSDSHAQAECHPYANKVKGFIKPMYPMSAKAFWSNNDE